MSHAYTRLPGKPLLLFPRIHYLSLHNTFKHPPHSICALLGVKKRQSTLKERCNDILKGRFVILAQALALHMSMPKNAVHDKNKWQRVIFLGVSEDDLCYTLPMPWA